MINIVNLLIDRHSKSPKYRKVATKFLIKILSSEQLLDLFVQLIAIGLVRDQVLSLTQTEQF